MLGQEYFPSDTNMQPCVTSLATKIPVGLLSRASRGPSCPDLPPGLTLPATARTFPLLHSRGALG